MQWKNCKHPRTVEQVVEIMEERFTMDYTQNGWLCPVGVISNLLIVIISFCCFPALQEFSICSSRYCSWPASLINRQLLSPSLELTILQAVPYLRQSTITLTAVPCLLTSCVWVDYQTLLLSELLIIVSWKPHLLASSKTSSSALCFIPSIYFIATFQWWLVGTWLGFVGPPSRQKLDMRDPPWDWTFIESPLSWLHLLLSSLNFCSTLILADRNSILVLRLGV